MKLGLPLTAFGLNGALAYGMTGSVEVGAALGLVVGGTALLDSAGLLGRFGTNLGERQ